MMPSELLRFSLATIAVLLAGASAHVPAGSRQDVGTTQRPEAMETSGPTEDEDLPPEARTVAVSPGGEDFAVGYADGTVSLLNADTGEEIKKLEPGLGEALWVLAYSPDGAVLAGLGNCGSIRFWNLLLANRDASTMPSDELVGIPELIRLYEWPFGARLLWSPSGDRLAVVHSSGRTSLWTRTGECVTRWDSAPRRTDHTVAWHRSKSRLYLAEEASIRVRDGATGTLLPKTINCREPIVTLALHPAEDLVATGHADYIMRIWSLGSGALQHEGRYPDPWLTEADDDVCSISWSPTGDRIGLSIRQGTHVFVLDAEDKSTIWMSPYHGAHFGEPVPVRWSPDGSHLWYSFSCAKGPLWCVLPKPHAKSAIRLGACLPDLQGDLGATIIEGKVHAVSLSGELLW